MNDILLFSHLHCRPVEFFPAITPQDQEFADMIVNKFSLPADEIQCLIVNIRKDLQDDLSGKNNSVCIPLFRNEQDKLLFGSDAEIEGLTMTTKDGIISLDGTDQDVIHFNSRLQKKRKKFNNYFTSETNRINSSKVRNDFQEFRIFAYFHASSLIQSQRNYAIGLCLIYFRFVKWKSESEFDPSIDAEIKYIDYIGSRVKSRGQKYQKYLSDLKS